MFYILYFFIIIFLKLFFMFFPAQGGGPRGCSRRRTQRWMPWTCSRTACPTTPTCGGQGPPGRRFAADGPRRKGWRGFRNRRWIRHHRWLRLRRLPEQPFVFWLVVWICSTRVELHPQCLSFLFFFIRNPPCSLISRKISARIIFSLLFAWLFEHVC